MVDIAVHTIGGTVRRFRIFVAFAMWCGIAVVAAPPSSASVVPIPLRTDPAVSEFAPVQTTYFLAWEQNAASNPNNYNIYAQPLSGGAPQRVNARNSQGFSPSAIAGTETMIYQEVYAGISRLYLYDLSGHLKKVTPSKVNGQWPYAPVASTKYIAFMRLSSKGRDLMLYNRTTHSLSRIASATSACSSCLWPTWVGASHLLYDSCSGRTYVCQVKILNIGGGTTTVPHQPAPYSSYGASMDESSNDIYFIRSTTYCGLFVELDRWHVGGATTTIYGLPEGIDGNQTRLGPDQSAPGTLDLLYSEWDCLGGQADIYEIASASSLSPVRAPTSGLSALAGARHRAEQKAAALGAIPPR